MRRAASALIAPTRQRTPSRLLLPRRRRDSSDSAASGFANRCARTAPLPRSRRLPLRSWSSSAASVSRYRGRRSHPTDQQLEPLSRRRPARPLDLSEGVHPEPLRERAQVLRTLEPDSPYAAIPRPSPACGWETSASRARFAGARVINHHGPASDHPETLASQIETPAGRLLRGGERRRPRRAVRRPVLRPAVRRPPAAVTIGSPAVRGAFVVSASPAAIVTVGLEPHLGPGRRRTFPAASNRWPIIGLPARLMS
jgi:hypothetical protein